MRSKLRVLALTHESFYKIFISKSDKMIQKELMYVLCTYESVNLDWNNQKNVMIKQDSFPLIVRVKCFTESEPKNFLRTTKSTAPSI